MSEQSEKRPCAAPCPGPIPADWPLDVLRTDESGEVDLEQLEHNLSLTPGQRLEQNDQFAEFVEIVRLAGRAYYGEDD